MDRRKEGAGGGQIMGEKAGSRDRACLWQLCQILTMLPRQSGAASRCGLRLHRSIGAAVFLPWGRE